MFPFLTFGSQGKRGTLRAYSSQTPELYNCMAASGPPWIWFDFSTGAKISAWLDNIQRCWTPPPPLQVPILPLHTPFLGPKFSWPVMSSQTSRSAVPPLCNHFGTSWFSHFLGLNWKSYPKPCHTCQRNRRDFRGLWEWLENLLAKSSA